MKMDRAALRALSKEMKISERPFAEAAAQAGMDEQRLLDCIRDWKQRGFVRRAGARIDHRSLGMRANALVAWAVPSRRLSLIGKRFAALARVSHVYSRTPRRGWPYTLYTMVHAESARRLKGAVDSMNSAAGHIPHIVLPTMREYTKRALDMDRILR
ncbi:MAG: hypothetical protein NT045_04390 [Candidatus Aureabacteria bacterium]|nr:hypothetical protein [Candidatus Auribacterota bacterium]